MELPLNSTLIRFLKKQGYEFWLLREENGPEKEAHSNIKLVPVQKTVCINLPEDYKYFKIKTIKDAKLNSGNNNAELRVSMLRDDISRYKNFLIKGSVSL